MSQERARIIGELALGNPETVDLLIDLEADEELGAKFESELLGGPTREAP